jgi:hypothetical protein
MASDGRQAIAYIRQHPLWFVGTSMRRFFYLWTGFWSFDRNYLSQEPLDIPNIFFSTTFTVLSLAGLWRAFRESPWNAFPYAVIMLCLPLVYYITHVEVYYRRQIDPMMVALAVYGVMSWRRQPAEQEGRVQAELGAMHSSMNFAD